MRFKKTTPKTKKTLAIRLAQKPKDPKQLYYTGYNEVYKSMALNKFLIRLAKKNQKEKIENLIYKTALFFKKKKFNLFLILFCFIYTFKPTVEIIKSRVRGQSYLTPGRVKPVRQIKESMFNIVEMLSLSNNYDFFSSTVSEFSNLFFYRRGWPVTKKRKAY